MNQSTISNITSLESLERLTNEHRQTLLPVLLYLIFLMVIGITGNAVVCYVYKSQLTERTSKFFLVYLACLDLISCSISIPFEISDVFLPYTFDSRVACKVFRFTTTWLQGLSGLTLVCVAYARYRKITRPFKELDNRIIPCCAVTVIVALLMAIPALAIFGKRTVKTHESSIEGRECSTDDDMLESPVRIVYYTCLLLTFIFSLVCFLAFYILIGVHIMKRKKMYIGESIQLRNSNKSTDGNSVSSAPRMVRQTNQFRVKTGRMTIIFLAVTVSFVLSFLPFLIVHILRATGTYFTSNENMAETLIYNLCVRSTYVNSAVNPLIYSCLNRGFRKDCAVKIFRMSRRK